MTKKMLFSLGQVVATPGALEAMREAGQSPMGLLSRHITGDWGEVDEFDARQNDLALEQDLRILSSYRVNGQRVWVITEHDRSATTFLLPSEY